MPVPTLISQLSQTAASNNPPGSESPSTADDYLRTYAAFIATLRDGKGMSAEVDVASAATTDIGAANSAFVRITGTTTITSFGANYNGPRFIRFAGALTLTHNASSLILPGGANIATVAGDTAIVVPLAAGWQMVAYQSADSGPKTPVVSSINGGQLAGLRNKIINGKMEIAQRGTSFAAAADGAYTVDRWKWQQSGAVVVTVSQQADVPGSAQEFQYSLRAAITTADAAIAASDFAILNQTIEGYNVRDLLGRTFTLSFWVRSTKTGTHCVSLSNSGSDRSYVAEYTISAANTWEFKTVTISGGLPVSGTWNYLAGAGLQCRFALASGTTFHTTANAWNTGNFLATTNQVNVLDTVGNIFAITGVQLEVGSAATPFEHRPFGAELSLCQRYFRQTGAARASQYAPGPSTLQIPVLYSPMRAAPSVLLGNASTASNASGISLSVDASGQGYWQWDAGSAAMSFWTVDLVVLSAEL